MGTWKLASPDHALTLDLNVSGQVNEVLSGTLIYQGRSYSVTGGWAASNSLPGRKASAFALSGFTGRITEGIPNFIAATGIMTGPGGNPASIDIRVGVSSSLEGTLNQYSGVLLPWDGADGLDTFDHVVVLMLENRSFDSVLGYMYPNGVPANAPRGKTFEGVTGKNLSNPVPSDAKYQPPPGITTIPVSPVEAGNYFQPYPDPGESYVHVNTQLFNLIDGGDNPPYNLPPQRPLPEPNMNGFVKDYIENYKAEELPKSCPGGHPFRYISHCSSGCSSR